MSDLESESTQHDQQEDSVGEQATPSILNLDQMSLSTHTYEILPYGLVLITDKSNGDSFLLKPMNPPQYISKENLAYVRKFYNENRIFTPEEKTLLHSIVASTNQELLEANKLAILNWYEAVEKTVGPISTKPTPEDLENPLYWNICPVEVMLHTGEVCSYALISQRAPCTEPTGIKRLLLKDVAEIRISPFAVPKDVLEAARKEGIELHMGDGFYAAEADGNYYAIDMYYDFRPSSLFFKKGNIKGADLHTIPTGMNESLLSKASFSDSIECVIIDGLW